MVFGYARVSTAEPNLELQLDALLKEEIPQKNIYIPTKCRAQRKIGNV